jgi:anti-sigma regulatory factor (Ser/Thr protein kinase)/anti-anti-sigma regulatory factor
MQIVRDTEAEIRLPADSSPGSLTKFQSEIDKRLSNGTTAISINCSDLIRVTSSHIGALWFAYTKCKDAGVNLNILSATSNLEESLKTADLHDLIIPAKTSAAKIPVIRIQGTNSDDLRLLAFEFHPTIEDINRALNEFRDFMLALGIDPETTGALETMFYETATNIREHSSLSASDWINVTSEVDSFGVTVQFTDPGERFDLTERDSSFDPGKAIKEGQTRGFGIELVKKLADSISYMRQDGHSNVLTMTRYWRNR